MPFQKVVLLLFLLFTITTKVSCENILAEQQQLCKDAINPINSSVTDTIVYRLPNNTKPISYDIHLTTQIHTQDNFNFSGVVAIRFKVLITSRTIALHQTQLKIVSAVLVPAADAKILNKNNRSKIITLIRCEYDTKTEILKYTSDSDLIAYNEYILTISYDGIHSSDKQGFFKSSYLRDDGTQRWFATTQFEAINARRAFPCFDEPGLRAFFTIQITHGSNYYAVSNMPIESISEEENGYTTTKFMTTSATMSTYLLAFHVSDFQSKLVAPNDRGLNQTVFVQSNNAIQTTEFGIECSVKILNALETYLGINYTFPKLDLVAYTNGGGMENWGLIVFGCELNKNENEFLYNEIKSTFLDKDLITIMIAHEFAHQWFGNLVAIRWWDQLWLKEGFGTLFQYLGANWLFPVSNYMDTFGFIVVQESFLWDARNTTTSMSHYVESPEDISEKFNIIGYYKSGCVLRMFLNAFTEKSFKEALTRYLQTHSNSVAVEDDLFNALETVVKRDQTLPAAYNVPTIFSSWTRQAGYPIVIVERNYQNDDIVLHQERFYIGKENQTTSPEIWWIPYNIATGAAANFSLTAATSWFYTRQTTIKESTLTRSDWLLLNKRQTGYYRVKYDLQNYKLLSEALIRNHSQIHLTSRAQLIDDAFNLALALRHRYDVAFDLTKYLSRELEYVPWASALRCLSLVDRLYADHDEYNKFANYIVKQLSNLYRDTGLTSVPNEHIWRKQARNDAIQWSCRLGSSECLSNTSHTFERHLSEGIAIHQDHRPTILCSGIRSANETQFDLLIRKLNAESDTTERTTLIDALACTSNETLRQRLWTATIITDENSSFLKSEADRYRAFAQIVANNNNNSTKLAIGFLKQNLDQVFLLYGRTNLNRALTDLSRYIVSNEDVIAEFNELLNIVDNKKYIDLVALNDLKRAIIDNKVWFLEHSDSIAEWIRKNGSENVMASVTLMCVLLLVSHIF